MHIQMMKVADLRPNDYNFNEMEESQLKKLGFTIKAQGFLVHPVIARSTPEGGFVIVDGEHQWRAAQLAGMEEIPVQVLDGITDMDAIAETYRRNGLRGTENRLKLARAIERMKQGGLSNVAVAKAFGKSEGWVRTALLYVELASLSSGRDGAPSESDIAKMPENAVRELVETFQRGGSPAPNADGESGSAPQDEATQEAKPTKTEKLIRSFLKLTPDERIEVREALTKMVRKDARDAKSSPSDEPQIESEQTA